MTSKLHKELSIRAVSWMNSRTTGCGMRWATEFYLAPGWVADTVLFAFPQIRFFMQLENIGSPDQWQVWKKEGFPDSLLYVFESKVSKADYKKSFSNNGYKRKLIGNLHYVITPKDLITVDELPEGWGWLIKSGNGLREIVTPRYNPISDEFRHQVGYRMLWAAYGHRASIEDWELKRGQLF